MDTHEFMSIIKHLVEEKKDFYIDGKWVSSLGKNELEVINPSTEEAFAKISLGNESDLNNAVKAAKEAFTKWKDVTKKER